MLIDSIDGVFTVSFDTKDRSKRGVGALEGLHRFSRRVLEPCEITLNKLGVRA